MLRNITLPIVAYGNFTRIYSPVTLNHEWPTLSRLVFLLLSSVIGTFLNGFFVSSFFIEHSLKRIGNVYHACLGICDMMITSLVMPTSGVVLLSGVWDQLGVCLGLQFVTVASTYSHSIFFTLVAAETYIRVCHEPKCYDAFLAMGVGLVSILVFAFGFILAGLGVYMGLDYDYCERQHQGNIYFRAITSIVIDGGTCMLTVYFLIASAVHIRCRSRLQLQYKRSQQYDRDYSMINLNIAAYTLYLLGWIPYIVIVYQYPDTYDSTYYHAAWIGVFRSMINGFLYSAMNRSFRQAFSHLFVYCCCKSSLSAPFRSRHRRAVEYKPPSGDVRVHIMHKAVVASSPQRAGTSGNRETQEL